MRTNVSNRHLPGVQSERGLTLGGEISRYVVYADDTYIGEIVYVRRQHARGGSTYGWRPASHPNVKLTTKVEAIRRLPHFVNLDAD